MNSDKLIPFAVFWLTLALDFALGAQDLTITPGATGCEVAKATIDKVVGSLIFKVKDNYIFERVGHTSVFGAKVFIKGSVGIWQLTSANLDSCKKAMEKLKYEEKIRSILCIDFSKAVFEDLKKPLYNLVCAYLLLEKHGKCPWRAEISEQRKTWKKITGHDLGSKFETSAKTIDENYGKEGTACLVCTSQPTDLIFIVDQSGSISSR